MFLFVISPAFAGPSPVSKAERTSNISTSSSYPRGKTRGLTSSKEDQRLLQEGHTHHALLKAEEVAEMSISAGMNLQSLYLQASRPTSVSKTSSRASFRNGGAPTFSESDGFDRDKQANRWDSLKDYGGENFGMPSSRSHQEYTYRWRQGTYGPSAPSEIDFRPNWAP